MKSSGTTMNKFNRLPWTFICAATMLSILCSCQGRLRDTAGMKIGRRGEQAYVMADKSMFEESASPRGVPRSEIARTSYEGPMPSIPREPMVGSPCMEQARPLPEGAYPPWTPDGIQQPWPQDEYLRDGGDRHMPTGVNRDWKVYGLEMEDAVAHYDTLAGRRIVEPSNEVFIYSPRFGAVRQVVGLNSTEQKILAQGMTENVALEKPTHTQLIGSAGQSIQPGNEISARPTHAFVMKQGDGAISTAVGPRSFQDGFKPYENITVIRSGEFEGGEALRLAKSAQAAVSWNETQAVQVVLDKQAPMTAVQDEKLESVYRVEYEGKPALRLIKVASTAFANPGEEVWFTLRFDNTGSEVIGNVTILDSLSTRLEYVPDSAQCSREAKIITEPNEGNSSVLRCELKDPLEAGQGGILRFRCRVR
jgi:uncharacterized repeat protein (TIGR01451 family)